MTSADKLNNLRQRWKSTMWLSRIPEDDQLTRALYHKQARWAAEAVLEGCGYGRLPEWQTPEYLDAVEDHDKAAREHRAIIERMWSERWALAQAGKPLNSEAA